MAAYRSATFTADATADMTASIDYLKAQAFVRGPGVGVTGYCLGGTLAWEIALSNPDVKAVAPYYGTVRQDLLDTLGRTRVAVFAVYGADDARVTAQSQTVDDQLKASGTMHMLKIYEGAGHSFFNDTRPRSGTSGYTPAAAAEAWKDTLAWFRQHLTA
jgi:carboxymethylenebutenolidase